ncbi:hypothetical protein [Fodinibius halophilus]|uniref:Uncharacterized protein n=1 Tax=Fodinibius halophilus TaxID=1736908 RepID=A0A6M1T4A6_9BACT|nr:hypothetical protein [Fodinibius halophilus]NGP87493.1 hypothetical protein [Fodinibius halophilus]
MEKSSNTFFSYPPNLHELDLATLVSMYRDRGIPKKAKPGEYFACKVTEKLIKEGKWWFGAYYSQKAWDETLTAGCEGYPLTEVELNVLGLVYSAADEAPRRDYVEQNSGAVGKLAYMIVNDLKEFGFLSIDDQDRLLITPRGEKALQGVSKQIYGKKFKPDMLRVNQGKIANPKMERAPKDDSEQANLF